MKMTLAGHGFKVPADSACQTASALALLRTAFEDHYVDRDHDGCLFFSGKTIPAATAEYDFSVTHRGDAVFLSEFSWCPELEPQRISRIAYVQAVVNFARAVRGAGFWDEDLAKLLRLAQQYLEEDCRRPALYSDLFHQLHGHRKQPLQLVVTNLFRPSPDGAPDWEVSAQVKFGPIRRGQLELVRQNGGTILVIQALDFDADGVHIAVRGEGAATLSPGDRLSGLQLFYG